MSKFITRKRLSNSAHTGDCTGDLDGKGCLFLNDFEGLGSGDLILSRPFGFPLAKIWLSPPLEIRRLLAHLTPFPRPKLFLVGEPLRVGLGL